MMSNEISQTRNAPSVRPEVTKTLEKPAAEKTMEHEIKEKEHHFLEGEEKKNHFDEYIEILRQQNASKGQNYKIPDGVDRTKFLKWQSSMRTEFRHVIDPTRLTAYKQRQYRMLIEAGFKFERQRRGRPTCPSTKTECPPATGDDRRTIVRTTEEDLDPKMLKALRKFQYKGKWISGANSQCGDDASKPIPKDLSCWLDKTVEKLSRPTEKMSRKLREQRKLLLTMGVTQFPQKLLNNAEKQLLAWNQQLNEYIERSDEVEDVDIPATDAIGKWASNQRCQLSSLPKNAELYKKERRHRLTLLGFRWNETNRCTYTPFNEKTNVKKKESKERSKGVDITGTMNDVNSGAVGGEAEEICIFDRKTAPCALCSGSNSVETTKERGCSSMRAPRCGIDSNFVDLTNSEEENESNGVVCAEAHGRNSSEEKTHESRICTTSGSFSPYSGFVLQASNQIKTDDFHDVNRDKQNSSSWSSQALHGETIAPHPGMIFRGQENNNSQEPEGIEVDRGLASTSSLIKNPASTSIAIGQTVIGSRSLDLADDRKRKAMEQLLAPSMQEAHRCAKERRGEVAAEPQIVESGSKKVKHDKMSFLDIIKSITELTHEEALLLQQAGFDDWEKLRTGKMEDFLMILQGFEKYIFKARALCKVADFARHHEVNSSTTLRDVNNAL